jgi:hypothetical protein
MPRRALASLIPSLRLSPMLERLLSSRASRFAARKNTVSAAGADGPGVGLDRPCDSRNQCERPGDPSAVGESAPTPLGAAATVF